MVLIQSIELLKIMKNIILVILITLTTKAYTQKYLGSVKKYSIEQGLKINLRKVEGLYVRIHTLEDLEYFNANVCKFKNLKDLDLLVKNIETYNFPKCLCKLKKLIFINFYDQTEVIQEFPKTFLIIKSLKYLQMRGDFKSIPKNITRLKKLEELRIFDSDSLILPTNLKKLKELTFLELYSTGINTIPTGLDNLEILLLQRNNFKQIPPEIFEYKKLTYLDISFNKIIEVPTDIQSLILNDNEIQEADVNSFSKLHNLAWLKLYNNKIPKILQEEIYTSLPKCKIRFDDFSRYNIE